MIANPEFVRLILLAGIGYILAANVLGFVLFAVDKGRARADGWRVPETTLLFVAAFGGWIGAKLAQLLLRHKTRKQPFGRILNLTGLLLPVWIAAGWAMAADKTDLYAYISAKVAIALDAKTYTSGTSHAASGSGGGSVMPKRFGPGSGS